MGVRQPGDAHPQGDDPAKIAHYRQTAFLRFRFSGTVSPAELGQGDDQRWLALFFERLTAAQPERAVDGPVLAANAAALPADPVYAEHFSGAPEGLWTDGTEATIRLPTPLYNRQGATLSAEVSAALDPKLLPVQHAAIFANGEAVGEWVFDEPGVQKRKIVIPPALLKAPTLEMQFRFAKTLSPTEAGTGHDGRRLALLFKNVQLYRSAPLEEPPAAPNHDQKENS